MAYPKLNKALTELKGMLIKPVNVASERRLTDKESATYDKYTPTNWFQKLPIIPDQETPPESGYGYTQSPYISQWTKMWGVSPITDLPKYRLMYRTVPVVKKAIDKTVATAISKGFMLELDPGVENREEILEYLQSWINQQENFKLTLQMIASDALTYGNAYAEIVYDEKSVTEEFSNDMEFHRVEIPDPHEDYKIGEHGVPYLPTVNYNGNGRYLQVSSKGNPVWVKPLDPLWMRVRRDSYGNVYGYLQYLSTPPVAFTTSKIFHVRFNPKSWWTENAYGTSMLLSLIRTQEAIWTIENDLILISHACAKPPLVFSCGSDEEPWTEGQLTSFVSSTSARGPGGDIYHRGDVGATPLPFPASSLAPLIAHLDIHMDQRMISLGVPPDLLGLHAGSNRSTATVTFDDWINTVQLLQQQLGDAIQEQLFRMIIENQFGEGAAVPKMVWNQVYEKDDSAEVQKILSLRMGNIITTNEARAMLGEVGHKLEPVTSGDSLLPPAAFMPQPGEQTEGNEMPSEDSILEDDEPVKNEASFKAEEEFDPRKGGKILAPVKAEEEEFEDVKIKEPYVFMPKKEEYMKVDQPTPLIASSPQGFSEPGTPSGTGQAHKPKNFPIEAEMGKTTGQGEEPVKDLTNVKIKKMGSAEGVDVWLVSGNKVAARYSDQWKHDNSTDDHNYIGGHHFVFDYIPENEIWVSDQDEESDRQRTALHEFVERKCMSEDGMNYALAHQEALKAEGNIPEAELQKRLYITPETVKEKLNTIYPAIKEQENTWQVGKKLIIFDDIGGIIYLKDGEKITDQQLIRSTEDIEKFVTKYKARKKNVKGRD